MTQVTQKEAVYSAITAVLSEAGIHFEDGMDVGPHMSRELRAQVNAILFEGFRAGSIQLDREFTDTELKGYVSGLQSNWIRKDKRLNGNVAYVAKNPGSRQGSGDTQLKAMKALLSTLTDPSERSEVEAAIADRQAEIAKAKAPTIDVTKLPDFLKKYVK